MFSIRVKRLFFLSSLDVATSRTLATKMNDLGIAPHVVEQLLGHSLGGVMPIYNRSQYLPEKAAVLGIWLERLELLANPLDNVLLLKTK